MKDTIIKYGLRNIKTQKLIRYTVSSNDGREDCGSTRTELGEHEEHEWLVDTAIQAEWVRHNSTEWYNAGFGTPEHAIKAEAYEVVKVVMQRQIKTEKVTMPTPLQVAEFKYGVSEPRHLSDLKYMNETMGKAYPQWSPDDYIKTMEALNSKK